MVTVRLVAITAALSFATALTGAAQAKVSIRDAGVLRPVLGAGGTSPVTVVVRNSARRAASGGLVRFRLGKKPLKGSVRIGKVGPRATKSARGRIVLPKALKPGSYALRVCLGRRCAKSTEPLGVLGAADPLGVLPHPDETGRRTGVISRDGGELSTVAADGRVYSLVVPAGALATDARITMTPLSGMDGLPFAGGLTGGVQLEPAGLEFSRPAALVISGENVRPQPDQVAFAYDGAGRDFHLSGWFTRTPDGLEGFYDPERSVVVPVEHFSGVGVAPATDLETARTLRYQAADARNRLSQQVGDVLADERQRQLLGEGDMGDLEALTGPALRDFLEQVILPEAAAASFSDAMYSSAVTDYLGWQRQLQLLGIDETGAGYAGATARVEALLKIAWEKLVERAEKRCYAGDFSIIARILPLERQHQLLGDGTGTPNEFSVALKRCFRFELRVMSRVEHRGSGGPSGLSGEVDETYQLEGTIPLRIDPSSGVLDADLAGDGTIPYTQVHQQGSAQISLVGDSGGRCQFRSTGVTVPAAASVTQGALGYAVKNNDVTRAEDPFVVIDLGDPQEQVHSECQTSYGDSSQDDMERNFIRYWSAAHQDDRENSDRGGGGPSAAVRGPWRIALTQSAWPTVGKLQFEKSDATYGYRVTDAWELVHTPPRRAPR